MEISTSMAFNWHDYSKNSCKNFFSDAFDSKIIFWGLRILLLIGVVVTERMFTKLFEKATRWKWNKTNILKFTIHKNGNINFFGMPSGEF